ncbi:innexin unc-9 [Patella vulgata]|uniref:innexin unc-9 n=1 Tax=Patella vulgata TaxID=6465 RepID=UPI0021803558|nr:innexin unc-9 [Patella vulgata]
MFTLILGDLAKGVSSSSVSDYVSDRLNHVLAVSVFCIFAIIVGLEQYVGDPIHCWCPAEFTDSHCNYTEAYCWVQDTYYIPQDEVVPWEKAERYEEEIKYYQWVPIILLFLAACFKIPNLIWCMLNSVTGVNIEKAINAAEDSIIAVSQERKDKIGFIASYLDRWLLLSKKTKYGTVYKLFETLSSFMCFCFGPKTCSYITGLYIFIKFVYFGVSISLLFLLNHMLAMDYLFYGWEVIHNLSQGEELAESPRFPRITMCDFQIRQLQNIQTYSVQCVLSVNLFNEKIFIFIWFLLVALCTCNAFSWFCALKDFAIPRSRMSWLKTKLKTLQTKRSSQTHPPTLQEKFAQHLGCDGVFVLRTIEDNTSEMVVCELLNELRRLFCDRVTV